MEKKRTRSWEGHELAGILGGLEGEVGLDNQNTLHTYMKFSKDKLANDFLKNIYFIYIIFYFFLTK